MRDAPEFLHSMTFSELLTQTICNKKNPVMVGLDPRFDWIPQTIRQNTDPKNIEQVAEVFKIFCREIIDVVAPLVPVIKIQAAFFEQYGVPGMSALRWLVDYIRNKKELVIVFDGKRNDIGSTAEAYAAGILGQDSPWGADALTVSPYLGDDSLEPFVKTAAERNAGIFVLVKTSNHGGAMLQDLAVDGKTIYRRVAEYVQQLSLSTRRESEYYGNVGAVVGATWPPQLAELRDIMPNTWFLVPGYGSQGGSAKDVAPAFDENGLGAIINNSRGIIFAYRREPFQTTFGETQWQHAVEAATIQMIQQLRAEIPEIVNNRLS
ncbi:MAG: orotidine-5'-phosphate decarboxylase [Planctomycetaceae bacterium]|jgi:orotidine-5'-phosphate decarboxylase|nr:orotidine-5'-phosphate decarboxylase [Planctomycetaceae bacterium]